MPRTLPDDEVATWSQTLCLLIIGFLCYALPWPLPRDRSRTANGRCLPDRVIGAAPRPSTSWPWTLALIVHPDNPLDSLSDAQMGGSGSAMSRSGATDANAGFRSFFLAIGACQVEASPPSLNGSDAGPLWRRPCSP